MSIFIAEISIPNKTCKVELEALYIELGGYIFKIS